MPAEENSAGLAFSISDVRIRYRIWSRYGGSW